MDLNYKSAGLSVAPLKISRNRYRGRLDRQTEGWSLHFHSMGPAGALEHSAEVQGATVDGTREKCGAPKGQRLHCRFRFAILCQ